MVLPQGFLAHLLLEVEGNLAYELTVAKGLFQASHILSQICLPACWPIVHALPRSASEVEKENPKRLQQVLLRETGASPGQDLFLHAGSRQESTEVDLLDRMHVIPREKQT